MLVPMVQKITKPDGKCGLRYNFHAGQLRAWNSTKRFPSIIAGAQSGKTAFLPLWLHREIERCGPGDYLAVSPSYKLMSLKMLPEFVTHFGAARLNLGEYRAADRTFVYHDGSVKIFFGHAADPESLESATAKAAVCDEAGQKRFRLGSWEAIQRRLGIHQGRCLIGTTPYDLGWLKQRLYDPWIAAGRNHPEIDVIGFSSLANPAFPRAEYERARRELPRNRFDLFYRGIFTTPPGLIYDCFKTETHTCPPFAIPDHWPRYLGLDFGGVNTAGVFIAEELKPAPEPLYPGAPEKKGEPTGRLFAYRVYGPCGGKNAKQHTTALIAGEPARPVAVGGAGSEDQWRMEFAAAGLGVREPPVSEVEVGIDRVYGTVQRGELCVFSDLHGLLDEFGSYSREVDELGSVGEKIEDKETFHRLDALRYVLSFLRGGKRKLTVWA